VSPFWLALAVFSIVLSARLIFIGIYGVDVPYWDQWDDEVKLYKAFLDGSLNLQQLFVSHNEHRIVLSRVLNVVLFWFNDGWNPLLGMAVQSILPSFTAAFIVFAFIADSKRVSILSLILTIIVFASPIVYENLLWSFQSQFYFQVFFTVLALRFAVAEDLKIRDYFLISLFCTLASLSNGGGFTVFFVVALIWGYRGLFSATRRFSWSASAIAAILLCIIFSLLIVEVKGHEFLKSKTVSQFFSVLYVNLGWPDKTGNGFGVFGIWIPSVLLLLRQLIKNKTLTRNELFCFALLAWGGIMAIATAYSRRYPGNRYGDFLLLYIPAGVFLFDSYVHKAGILKFGVFSVLVKAATLFGIIQISISSLGSLNDDYKLKSVYIQNLNESLVLENKSPGSGLAFLARQHPHSELPHPSPQTIWNELTGELKPYMPGAIKIPDRIEPSEQEGTHFRTVPDSVRLLPTQTEMGTFIRSAAWTGSIQSRPIEIRKERFDLYVAGGCRSQEPDGLNMSLRFMPSNEELILNRDSGSCAQTPEKWRLVSIKIPENSRQVVVTLNDRMVSKNGWLAVGGIFYPNRFDDISRGYRRWTDFLDE